MDDLGQIADLHRGAQPDLARVGDLLPHDHLDEGGLTGAVVPQQGDALAPRHLQVHMLEESPVPEGLLQILDDHDLISPELPLAEFDVQLPVLPGLVRLAQAGDALFHGEGPLVELVVAHEGPQVHLVRRRLELLDLGLLLFILAELLLIAALLLLHIVAVIAGVELGLAVLQLDDPTHHLVQEPAVMGDGKDGAFEPGEVVLQPLGAAQVQVVGGLVQQQHVGVLQNEAAQVHPGLLTAGEVGEGTLAHVGGDVQAVAHLVEGGLHVVAAAGLEGGGQGVIPAQEGGIALPRRHPGGEGLHLLFHILEPLEGRPQHHLHRIALGVHRDLGDEPHPLARGHRHLALVGLQLSGEDTEEGGLARSVLAQQAHSLPGVHLEGDPVQDLPAHFKFFGDV